MSMVIAIWNHLIIFAIIAAKTTVIMTIIMAIETLLPCL
jgi:hypothetical protein